MLRNMLAIKSSSAAVPKALAMDRISRPLSSVESLSESLSESESEFVDVKELNNFDVTESGLENLQRQHGHVLRRFIHLLMQCM